MAAMDATDLDELSAGQLAALTEPLRFAP